MRNRILYITRNTIPYVKELMPIAQSVTGCILMQQLDYWFERCPNGFYKFQSAVDHPAYRVGQSWVEELGISADRFRIAFDRIGVRYISKSDYRKAPDKFKGRFYCSYYDRRTGLTHYLRNHELLDKRLDALVACDSIHAKQSDESIVLLENRANHQVEIARDRETQFLGKGRNLSAEKKNFQSAETGNLHSQQTELVHFHITETTDTETKQKLQPQTAVAMFEDGENSPLGHRGSPENLVFPTKALPAERQALVVLMHECPIDYRQAILDEIEGAIRKRTLRNGIVPFGRSLVRIAKAGKFSPSLGIEVLAKREALINTAEHLKADVAAIPPVTWAAINDASLALLPPRLRERARKSKQIADAAFETNGSVPQNGSCRLR